MPYRIDKSLSLILVQSETEDFLTLPYNHVLKFEWGVYVYVLLLFTQKPLLPLTAYCLNSSII